MSENPDTIVIGGGIAGVSAACELVLAGAAVLLLETEDQLAYHSTGRSAAMLFQNYGPPNVRRLTRAARPFFMAPPTGFSEHPLVAPRGALLIAPPGQEDEMANLMADGDGMVPISLDEALAKVPLLRRDKLAVAAYEADAQDLDVHALHGGYLKCFRAAGGQVVTRAEVLALRHERGGWTIESKAGRFAAPVVVNAAGAWADLVAGLAGLGPLGIQPKRRTAVIIEGPDDGHDSAAWPLIDDVAQSWYGRPEAGGKLLISPADETPVPPCDVQPEELDIALAVDRFQNAVDLVVRRVEHSWAGLRSFAPDGDLVIGWDPRADGFFWLAGQGGYGIQTAPAASRLTAGLIRQGRAPDLILETGLDPAALSPARLIDS